MAHVPRNNRTFASVLFLEAASVTFRGPLCTPPACAENVDYPTPDSDGRARAVGGVLRCGKRGHMQLIKLAKLDDFAETRIKSFQVLGKFIAIVREPDGSFYATEIACKHNNADLTTGRFDGDVVTCSRHG